MPALEAADRDGQVGFDRDSIGRKSDVAAESRGVTAETVVRQVLEAVAVP